MKYNQYQDGSVKAIRIYYADNGISPMADLILAYGGKITIQWDNIEQREIYSKGINGYTLYYDEREKVDFKSFITQ
jgi:hypothetical protein